MLCRLVSSAFRLPGQRISDQIDLFFRSPKPKCRRGSCRRLVAHAALPLIVGGKVAGDNFHPCSHAIAIRVSVTNQQDLQANDWRCLPHLTNN